MQRLKFDIRRDSLAADESAGAMQLAIDEAMLVWAEAAVDFVGGYGLDTESVRFWCFDRPTVVLGRSSRLADEVNQEWCKKHNIEVLRRCTGGASVVGGPGCLMYSLVLKIGDARNLRKIDLAHDHVMERVLSAVRHQIPNAEKRGICDLTIGEKKFSGNSLRVMRHHLLYHGTVLIDADLQLIADCLAVAPRQPEYRRGRDHHDFITNVELRRNQLCDDLASALEADDADDLSENAIWRIGQELMQSRYRCLNWHHKH